MVDPVSIPSKIMRCGNQLYQKSRSNASILGTNWSISICLSRNGWSSGMLFMRILILINFCGGWEILWFYLIKLNVKKKEVLPSQFLHFDVNSWHISRPFWIWQPCWICCKENVNDNFRVQDAFYERNRIINSWNEGKTTLKIPVTDFFDFEWMDFDFLWFYVSDFSRLVTGLSGVVSPSSWKNRQRIDADDKIENCDRIEIHKNHVFFFQ